jgi:hypothetical protein
MGNMRSHHAGGAPETPRGHAQTPAAECVRGRCRVLRGSGCFLPTTPRADAHAPEAQPPVTAPRGARAPQPSCALIRARNVCCRL